MTRGGQSQKGGQGSQQIQVAGDLVLGINEERAKEIAVVTARQVISDYTDEALALVRTRIDELDTRVIQTLEEKQQLNSFSDPAFQRTYRKAQNAAAVSDREIDYDMLAALLSDRATKPNNRHTLTGIERAIEIIDLVDTDALRALTVVVGASKWSPNAAEIELGLDVMNDMFTHFMDGPLPTGREWSEHLDILDAVRVSSSTEFMKFESHFIERHQGYAAPGILREEVPEFVGGACPDVPWAGLVMDHELRPGYVRIAAPSLKALAAHLIIQDAPNEFVEEIVAKAEHLFGVGHPTEESLDAFKQAFRKRPALVQVAEWWDQIPKYVRPTAVGMTLAVANAFRLDASNLLPRDE